jgi:lipid-A-disaccharide synthase
MEKLSKKVFVSAGEYSGSVYVAAVIRELRGRYQGLEFEGVGGCELENAGVRILHNSDRWGSIGIVEALKRWKLILVHFQVCAHLEKSKPDLLILADYPGFNMALCRKAREMGIPTVYLFPPRKFARSAKSVRDAAAQISRVAAEFRTTFDTYQEAGANVDFVGHPMIDMLPRPDRSKLRSKLELEANEKVVLLMPGSRHQELALLLPLFKELVVDLASQEKGLRFHLLGAGNLKDEERIRSRFETFVREMKQRGIPIELFWKNRFEQMCVSDFAIVTSGTATLELAYYRVPMVICYKVTRMTAFLARFFSRIPPYIGLPNLLANNLIVPEFVQEKALAPEIVKDVLQRLHSPETLEKMRTQLGLAVEELGEPGSISRIIQVILDELGVEPTQLSDSEDDLEKAPQEDSVFG